MAGQVSNASCTGQPGDGHEPNASWLLVNPANVPDASACHLFTLPESVQDRPPLTVSPPAAPMPSTPFSNGTLVPAAADVYWQFSDSYKPVPLPAAYLAAA